MINYLENTELRNISWIYRIVFILNWRHVDVVNSTLVHKLKYVIHGKFSNFVFKSRQSFTTAPLLDLAHFLSVLLILHNSLCQKLLLTLKSFFAVCRRFILIFPEILIISTNPHFVFVAEVRSLKSEGDFATSAHWLYVKRIRHDTSSAKLESWMGRKGRWMG